MIGVYELRISVAFMSCAQETNALRMISVVIGSAAADGGRVAVSAMVCSLSDSRDDDAAVLIERGRAARWDERGRALLLDHDRPCERAQPRQPLAEQDGRLVLDAGKDDLPGAKLRVLSGWGKPRWPDGSRNSPERREPQVHELDRGAGRRVPVADAVRIVERAVDLLE